MGTWGGFTSPLCRSRTWSSTQSSTPPRSRTVLELNVRSKRHLEKVVMARAQRAGLPDDSGGLSDDFAQRREESTQVGGLLLGVVEPLQQARKVAVRDLPALGNLPRQAVDAALDAQALRVERERARIAFGQRRLDFVPGKPRPLSVRVDQRLDSIQELTVFGHEDSIMSRRAARRLWAERPIFSIGGPRRLDEVL